MQPLSSAAHEALAQIATRHGFSVEASQAMLDAIVRGGGRMAQFSHPEFSGSGQWMRGGMTMVSDMFNNDLKGWVDALCNDLSNLLAERPELLRPAAAPRSPVPAPDARAPRGAAATGWPPEGEAPSSSGSQNGSRYAVFDGVRRLAIEREGRTTIYDTLDHRIGGVSQQQGAGGSMRFTSQHGAVDLAELPVVSGSAASAGTAVTGTAAATGAAPNPDAKHSDDIPATIEKLADLQTKGILSREEFNAKKVELLARI